MVTILDAVKEMTQPEIMGMVRRTAMTVQEGEDVHTEPPSMFALLKSMRDPQTRRRLARVMSMLHTVGEEHLPAEINQPEGRNGKMPTATIAGQEVQINDEGFLTEYDEWNEDIAEGTRREYRNRDDRTALGRHQVPARGLQGEERDRHHPPGADGRGFPTKEQFVLFPKKPAKRWPTSPACPSPTVASRKDETS